MKFTIRNKLIFGFAGALLMMTGVAGVGTYAVSSLRRSAQDATRVGGQLNAVALEIQVHNLEAARRVRSYLTDVKNIGPAKAREVYLEEANFEINEIRSLAARAASIAPGEEKRAKFNKISETLEGYESALNRVVSLAEAQASPQEMTAAAAAYESVAEALHENAEDGEVAGQDASQASQEDINQVSHRAMLLVVTISAIGILLGLIASYTLSRAILIPVEHLKSVAENVSLGNLDMAVRRFSEDEIGDLADSFSRMVTAVKFFRMEAELVQPSTPAQKGEPE